MAAQIILGLLQHTLHPEFYGGEMAAVSAATAVAQELVRVHSPELYAHLASFDLPEHPVHFFGSKWLPRLFVDILRPPVVTQAPTAGVGNLQGSSLVHSGEGRGRDERDCSMAALRPQEVRLVLGWAGMGGASGGWRVAAATPRGGRRCASALPAAR